ncbi:MAG: cation:proton antiporter [Candidatus Calescibacterium sp.]|nr:cation:proton antiporter [Candidatus Calescibacterium sp.]MCX7972050.1 cation:proton antiporter [bacterium]MDW8194666.1 cation:proton antiporter [Candidatus Calescibacterium sp.]
MTEIYLSISIILVFLFSLVLRSSFVLTSIFIGSLIALLKSYYNFHFSTGSFEIFSEIAISFIFFSLGLGYTLDAFLRNLKRTVVPSILDLLNLFVPFTITYLITKDFFFSFALGMCLYPSSTAIVVKVLEFHKKLASKSTDIIIGILLFEDIILIALLSFLTIFSAHKSSFSSVILSILIISVLFTIWKFVLSKRPLITERYLQEDVGIFFSFGYFLFLYFICKKFGLPELLIMFSAALFIPTDISNMIKSKLEPIKNFSVGIFIIDFTSRINLGVLNSIDYRVLILVPLFVFLKIITIYLAFRYARIKYKREDVIFFIPRGEFTAYISKLANLEIFGFLAIILSNTIALIENMSVNKKSTYMQKK